MEYLDELLENSVTSPSQEESISRGKSSPIEIPDTPVTMGFKNFSGWRPYQKQMIEEIISSPKKIFFADAPCGTGKSLSAMAASKNFNKSIYVCTTKSLQDQLIHDFPSIPVVKGRQNYPCLFNDKVSSLFPEYTADDCPGKLSEGGKHQGKIHCFDICPYNLAKRKALASPIAILNTTYFLIEANFVGSFSGIPFIIIDEADELEDQLMKFVEIVLTEKMLHRLHISPPRYKTKFDSWRDWARAVLPRILSEVNGLERSINNPIDDRSTMRLVSSLKSLTWKLNLFINVVDKNWVYIEAEDKWIFKPIWVSMFGSEYIFNHGDKFLLMSATILSPVRLAQNLGIERGDWRYMSIPSQFSPERRRVVYKPIANISQKTKTEELPKLIPAIRYILNHHKEKKGLIHTVSYSNAKYLMDNFGDKRLIIHNSKNREEVLKKFKFGKAPLVMVSPSMGRGIDLPYEQCRFQVLIKTPFPDIGDKQIAARLYSGDYGRQWYCWVAACSIVQMSGRSTRAEDDFSIVYILDSNFGKFYKENSQLFPSWWKEGLEME